MPVDSCICEQCVSACKRIPGLFHPTEALRAIRAGYADDLMSVWASDEHRYYSLRRHWRVLMPISAPPPYIRQSEFFDPRRRRGGFEAVGRCIFLNVDNRCEIHDSGFKPVECRHALLCKSVNTDRQHDGAKAAWDSPVGRFVLDLWKRELERIGL
jgi:Fe-S-cluster containining protein